MSGFASIPVASCHFFTWFALGGVDLHFLLMFLKKPSAIKEETT